MNSASVFDWDRRFKEIKTIESEEHLERPFTRRKAFWLGHVKLFLQIFDLFSLINVISTFVGCLMPNPLLLKNSRGTA